MLLVPVPKELRIFNNEKFYYLNESHIIINNSNKEEMFFIAKQIQGIINEELKKHIPILIEKRKTRSTGIIFIQKESLNCEEYILIINPNSIEIIYSKPAGAFYGVMTLKQIISQYGGVLPCLIIQDSPDYQVRGIMLDISRNKIPAMKELFRLIDFMAELKLNQLQLYVEGFSFAYPSFPEVWKDRTPMTGQEIMEIDEYCKARHIELVSNHNSFGHMTDWLKRKEFNHLAECPDGYTNSIDNVHRDPGTLNPIDDNSLKLIGRMYDDFLPYFTSSWINVGCDETYELGRGFSKEACEEKGRGKVYLEFLLKLNELVHKHGKRMMFWGDIINEYPELIDQLPKDIITLEWGYEEEHPFDIRCKQFQKSGIPYYVCPGTSSWESISGRTNNMKKNLYNAAISGKENDAIGYLNTDWGGNGHWQYPCVSYPGFVYGAALSWDVEKNENIDIADYLNLMVFKDENNIMGQFILDLGNYYLKETKKMFNGTYISKILVTDIEINKFLNVSADIKDMKVEDIESIEKYVEQLARQLDKANMTCENSNLVYSEFRNTIRFIRHGCKLGKLKLAMDQKKIENKEKLLNEMIDEIGVIIVEHQVLWIRRNRIGGLNDSLDQLLKLKDYYYSLL